MSPSSPPRNPLNTKTEHFKYEKKKQSSPDCLGQGHPDPPDPGAWGLPRTELPAVGAKPVATSFRNASSGAVTRFGVENHTHQATPTFRVQNQTVGSCLAPTGRPTASGMDGPRGSPRVRPSTPSRSCHLAQCKVKRTPNVYLAWKKVLELRGEKTKSEGLPRLSNKRDREMTAGRDKREAERLVPQTGGQGAAGTGPLPAAAEAGPMAGAVGGRESSTVPKAGLSKCVTPKHECCQHRPQITIEH